MEPDLTGKNLLGYMDNAHTGMSYKRGLYPTAETVHPNIVVLSVLQPDESEASWQTAQLKEAVKLA